MGKENVADEIFAWDRTVSRLMEMQSTKYLSEQVPTLDGEQFLSQFKLMSLTEEDMRNFWRRYDKDGNDELDLDELRTLLEDLLEKQQGHRNLTSEVFDVCVSTIDTNKDSKISFEEFQVYLSDFNLVQSTVRA